MEYKISLKSTLGFSSHFLLYPVNPSLETQMTSVYHKEQNLALLYDLFKCQNSWLNLYKVGPSCPTVEAHFRGMYLRMFTVLRANDEAEDNKSAWPKKDNELQKNEISEKEKKKKKSVIHSTSSFHPCSLKTVLPKLLQLGRPPFN